MKLKVNKELGLPVYYNTITYFQVDNHEKESNIGSFPRISVERLETSQFRAVNYHKPISKIIKPEN
jgi:hypothetical protein